MIVFSAESSGFQTYSAAPPAFAERTIFQPPPLLHPTSTNSQIRLQNSQRYFHEKLQKITNQFGPCPLFLLTIVTEKEWD